MHPWLLELHLRQILLLGWHRRQLLAARQAAQSCGKLSLLMRTTLFSLERLHPSRVYRKQDWDLRCEFLAKDFQFFAGQDTEERFQNNNHLPHAR
jgi:hypothetical protein